MKSHEYAEQLERMAKYLRSKQEFDLPSYMSKYYAHDVWYMNDRPAFLAAVKALGDGEKKIDTRMGYVEFYPTDGDGFHVRTEKSSVCKMIREAEYDCDESWLKQIA